MNSRDGMKRSSAPDGGAGSARQQKHILVVEDEVLIRMLISDTLRDEGYSVIEAFNAQEALDIINAGMAVDLVFSDVRMPGPLDGLGLLNVLRQRFPHIPVILTSGHLEPVLALRGGAAHFVRKPYVVDEVVDLIATELARSR
jgi:CheY-like chemotaxis protein